MSRQLKKTTTLVNQQQKACHDLYKCLLLKFNITLRSNSSQLSFPAPQLNFSPKINLLD